jgi:hypothetical protein
MKNVYKGFQVSKLAIPTVHAAKINADFVKVHSPTYKRPFLRLDNKVATAKTVKPIGKY